MKGNFLFPLKTLKKSTRTIKSLILYGVIVLEGINENDK